MSRLATGPSHSEVLFQPATFQFFHYLPDILGPIPGAYHQGIGGIDNNQISDPHQRHEFLTAHHTAVRVNTDDGLAGETDGTVAVGGNQAGQRAPAAHIAPAEGGG